jgi:pimeloyl-ACP methyl ester carboxylesterase
VNRRLLLAGAGVLAGAGLVAGASAVARSRRPAAPVTVEYLGPDTPEHQGGAGSPLLLIHGFTVTWRTWKPVLPLLEQHHQVIAPTLLGHSGAAVFADGVQPSLDALVDGVEAELDRLGLDRVHVAGNSLGGWIALELARRGRARSVTAFSPAGGPATAARTAMVAVGFRAGLVALDALGERAERLTLTPRGRRMLFSGQFEHPERVEPAELIADLRAVRNAPLLKPILAAITSSPIQPLPDPGCPVRVVWARRDRIIPFRYYGEPMLRQLPTAELIMLDGVGHVPMPDDPQAVARLILEVTNAVDARTEVV